jgi:hypothetical protein
MVAYVTSTDIDGNPLTLSPEGTPTLLPIPFTFGSVSAQIQSRVTRKLTLDLAADWFPTTSTSPLSESAAVLTVRAGLKYGNGTEETFPLFKGRVQNPVRNDDGTVSVEADDLAADVIGYPFERPWRVQNPGSVLTEIQAIILDAVPQATFDLTGAPLDQPIPADLVFDDDRGEALDDLSAVLGARWYTLGSGAFTVRAYGYEGATPLLDIHDGGGGTLISAQVGRSRDGVANSVTVVSERLDGTDPVIVTRRDNGTFSPTRFGGPFGKVARVVRVQTPLTQQQATDYADALLRAGTALVSQWDGTMVPDYSLEPGDCARLTRRGFTENQVFDTLTYPLIPEAVQSYSARSVASIPVPELVE